MNSVNLMGRLTRDPENRTSQSGKAIARFTLAVNRFANGERTADFIDCVAFGKSAELVSKYLTKGRQVCVTGNLKTGRYEKDGITHYTTEVWVERVDFCSGSGSGQQNGDNSASADNADMAFNAEDIPF